MDDFEDVETDDRQTGQNPSDLVKQLRKKIREDAKAMEDLAKEFKTLKAADRTRAIEKVLAEKNIPVKVARLIPDAVDATETAVDEWLNEYNDLFGVATNDTTNDNDPGVSAVGAVDRTTLARIDQSAQAGARPADRMAERIQQLKTMPETDFLKLISDAQGVAV